MEDLRKKPPKRRLLDRVGQERVTHTGDPSQNGPGFFLVGLVDVRSKRASYKLVYKTNAPRKPKKGETPNPKKEFTYKAPTQALRDGRPSVLLYAAQLDKLIKAAQTIKAFMIENGYQHE